MRRSRTWQRPRQRNELPLFGAWVKNVWFLRYLAWSKSMWSLWGEASKFHACLERRARLWSLIFRKPSPPSSFGQHIEVQDFMCNLGLLFSVVPHQKLAHSESIFVRDWFRHKERGHSVGWECWDYTSNQNPTSCLRKGFPRSKLIYNSL